MDTTAATLSDDAQQDPNNDGGKALSPHAGGDGSEPVVPLGLTGLPKTEIDPAQKGGGGWACYACGSGRAEFVARNLDFGLPIHACLRCGLVQTDRVLGDELEAYYGSSYSDAQGRSVNPGYSDFSSRRGRVQRDLVCEVTGRRRFDAVLDFGAGAGGAARAFGEISDHVVCWDPDPKIRSNLASISLADVLGRDVLFSGRFDGYFDCIVLSHVLEHFADPLFELAHLNRLLSEDGVLFIEVPFEPSGVVRLIADQLKMGVGHVFHFNRQTLTDLVERDGYFVVEDLRQCGPDAEKYFLDRASLDRLTEENDRGVWLRAVVRRSGQAPLPTSRHSLDERARQRRFEVLSDLSAENVELRQALRRVFERFAAVSGGGAAVSPSMVRSDNLPTEALERLLSGAENAYGALEQRLRRTEETRESLQSQIAALTAAKDEQAAVVARVADEVAQQVRESEQRQAQAGQAAALEIKRLKRAYDDIEDTVTELRAALSEAESDKTQLKGRLDEALEDAAFKDQYARIAQEHEDLRGKYLDLEKKANQGVHDLKEARLARHLVLKERANLRDRLATAEQSLTHLRTSNSFKLGYRLVAPLRVLRRLFSR